MTTIEELKELERIYDEINLKLIILESATPQTSNELYEINQELQSYQKILISVEDRLIHVVATKAMDDILVNATFDKEDLITSFNRIMNPHKR